MGGWTLPFKSSRLVEFIPKMHNYAQDKTIIFQKKIQKMQRIKHLIHNHKKMHDYPQDETLIFIIIKMKDIHNYS